MTFCSLISSICAFCALCLRCITLRHAVSSGSARQWRRFCTPLDCALLFLLLCQLVAALFDANGPRFALFTDTSFRISEAATAFRSLVDQEGLFIKALTLCAVTGAAALLCLRWRRGSFDTLDRVLLRQTGLILLTAALLICACLLISARTAPDAYGAGIWPNFGIFFYQLVLMLLCLGYCLRRVASLQMLAPFLLCYCLTGLLNPTKLYIDTTPHLQRRYAISWVNVVRAAAARGDSQATIAVPTRGWPLPADWFPKVLAHTLYVYGIVDRPISIETRIGAPDTDMEASPAEVAKDAAAAAPRARAE